MGHETVDDGGLRGAPEIGPVLATQMPLMAALFKLLGPLVGV
jgi:hypothetical protein